MDEVLKCKTVKHLRKHKENLQNSELGKFLGLIPRAQCIKGNTGHLNLIKNKTFFSVKNYVKGRKDLLQIWRKYLQTTME